MILCVYHGSSFKEVNATQTANITSKIKAEFNEHEVIECYYSSRVLKIMERRSSPLLSFEQALKANYSSNTNIYVLITNMMNGSEYQSILKTISTIDCDGKVKATPYMLAESNVYTLAKAIVNKDAPTLFIGHGSIEDNSDYTRLNNILYEDCNYVTTLHSDVEQLLSQHFYSKNLIVKPLMITSAYHARRDIEVELKSRLIELGYNPQLDLTPLCMNEAVIYTMVENLSQLINDEESLF